MADVLRGYGHGLTEANQSHFNDPTTIHLTMPVATHHLVPGHSSFGHFDGSRILSQHIERALDGFHLLAQCMSKLMKHRGNFVVIENVEPIFGTLSSTELTVKTEKMIHNFLHPQSADAALVAPAAIDGHIAQSGENSAALTDEQRQKMEEIVGKWPWPKAMGLSRHIAPLTQNAIGMTSLDEDSDTAQEGEPEGIRHDHARVCIDFLGYRPWLHIRPIHGGTREEIVEYLGRIILAQMKLNREQALDHEHMERDVDSILTMSGLVKGMENGRGGGGGGGGDEAGHAGNDGDGDNDLSDERDPFSGFPRSQSHKGRRSKRKARGTASGSGKNSGGGSGRGGRSKRQKGSRGGAVAAGASAHVPEDRWTEILSFEDLAVTFGYKNLRNYHASVRAHLARPDLIFKETSEFNPANLYSIQFMSYLLPEGTCRHQMDFKTYKYPRRGELNHNLVEPYLAYRRRLLKAATAALAEAQSDEKSVAPAGAAAVAAAAATAAGVPALEDEAIVAAYDPMADQKQQQHQQMLEYPQQEVLALLTLDSDTSQDLAGPVKPPTRLKFPKDVLRNMIELTDYNRKNFKQMQIPDTFRSRRNVNGANTAADSRDPNLRLFAQLLSSHSEIAESVGIDITQPVNTSLAQLLGGENKKPVAPPTIRDLYRKNNEERIKINKERTREIKLAGSNADALAAAERRAHVRMEQFKQVAMARFVRDLWNTDGATNKSAALRSMIHYGSTRMVDKRPFIYVRRTMENVSSSAEMLIWDLNQMYKVDKHCRPDVQMLANLALWDCTSAKPCISLFKHGDKGAGKSHVSNKLREESIEDTVAILAHKTAAADTAPGEEESDRMECWMEAPSGVLGQGSDGKVKGKSKAHGGKGVSNPNTRENTIFKQRMSDYEITTTELTFDENDARVARTSKHICKGNFDMNSNLGIEYVEDALASRFIGIRYDSSKTEEITRHAMDTERVAAEWRAIRANDIESRRHIQYLMALLHKCQEAGFLPEPDLGFSLYLQDRLRESSTRIIQAENTREPRQVIEIVKILVEWRKLVDHFMTPLNPETFEGYAPNGLVLFKPFKNEQILSIDKRLVEDEATYFMFAMSLRGSQNDGVLHDAIRNAILKICFPMALKITASTASSSLDEKHTPGPKPLAKPKPPKQTSKTSATAVRHADDPASEDDKDQEPEPESEHNPEEEVNTLAPTKQKPKPKAKQKPKTKPKPKPKGKGKEKEKTRENKPTEGGSDDEAMTVALETELQQMSISDEGALAATVLLEEKSLLEGKHMDELEFYPDGERPLFRWNMTTQEKQDWAKKVRAGRESQQERIQKRKKKLWDTLVHSGCYEHKPAWHDNGISEMGEEEPDVTYVKIPSDEIKLGEAKGWWAILRNLAQLISGTIRPRPNSTDVDRILQTWRQRTIQCGHEKRWNVSTKEWETEPRSIPIVEVDLEGQIWVAISFLLQPPHQPLLSAIIEAVEFDHTEPCQVVYMTSAPAYRPLLVNIIPNQQKKAIITNASHMAKDMRELLYARYANLDRSILQSYECVFPEETDRVLETSLEQEAILRHLETCRCPLDVARASNVWSTAAREKAFLTWDGPWFEDERKTRVQKLRDHGFTEPQIEQYMVPPMHKMKQYPECMLEPQVGTQKILPLQDGKEEKKGLGEVGARPPQQNSAQLRLHALGGALLLEEIMDPFREEVLNRSKARFTAEMEQQRLPSLDRGEADVQPPGRSERKYQIAPDAEPDEDDRERYPGSVSDSERDHDQGSSRASVPLTPSLPPSSPDRSYLSAPSPPPPPAVPRHSGSRSQKQSVLRISSTRRSTRVITDESEAEPEPGPEHGSEPELDQETEIRAESEDGNDPESEDKQDSDYDAEEVPAMFY